MGVVDDSREPEHSELAEPGVEKARPVVIGEQQNRVDYAANMFDAETYPGLTAEEAGLPEGSAELKAAQLEHNKAWISQMKEEGRLVIDTGPAEWRSAYPEPTRPSDWPQAPYQAELSAIEDYPNVIRPWADMTEAPNFPWKYDPSSYHEGVLHRDEGTPATDAAVGQAGQLAADSPGTADAPATYLAEADSGLTRDEGIAPDEAPDLPGKDAAAEPRDERTGRAYTVRTPFPRPAGQASTGPVDFKYEGSARDLVPPDQRAPEVHPLPMGYDHIEHFAHTAPDPDPAAAVRNDQGRQTYPGVDVDWHNRQDPLPKGERLVQTVRIGENGEPQPGHSPYFTDLETFKQSGTDAYEYSTREQVGAQRGEYLNVAIYELTSNISEVAEGTATQNQQFGTGGNVQFFTRGPYPDRALNPHDDPGLFRLLSYGEVKDELGFDGIPDDLNYIPMTHKTSAVDVRGLGKGSAGPSSPDA